MSFSSDESAAESPQESRLADLLAAARAGSGEAIGELVEKCRPYLMLIANQELDERVRAKLGASDVVQETLITVQRSIADFHGRSEDELLAWMRGILVNDLHDAHRRYRGTSKRQIDREVSLAGDSQQSRPPVDVTDKDRTPVSEAVAAEEAEALRLAIGRLSEDYATVLRLRNWQQLSFAEIGQRMGRSGDAVRKLWARAIQRLQEELGTDDAESGPPDAG